MSNLKQKKSNIFNAIFIAVLLLFSLEKSWGAPEIPQLGFEVLRTLPHDEKHFTQGLVFRGGKLFESAGGYGQSAVYEKDLVSGRTLRRFGLPAEIFAEGLAHLGQEFFLLSWRNGTAFVLDASLRETRRFGYATEGWGLTQDGKQLVMSDGSSLLRWLDPHTGAVKRQQQVTAAGAPLTQLNELEYARGFIFANLWHSDRVAMIDPADGRVRAWLDLSALKTRLQKPPQWNEQEHVLNGIAYDAGKDLFYVTGKRWPALFELRVASFKDLR